MTRCSRLFLALFLISTSLNAAPLQIGGLQQVSPLSFGPAVNGQGSAEIAFNGRMYFAIWHDFRSGRKGEVFGARIAPDGEVLDPLGINISGPQIDDNDEFAEPSVTWADGVFVAAWRSLSRVYSARVRENGTLLDPTPVVADAETSLAGAPALSSNGSSVFVATGRCLSPVRAWSMRSDGSKIGEIPLPFAGLCPPAVASDGQHYLVATNADRALAWAITDDRSVLASGSTGFRGFGGHIAATWTGSEYLVAAGALTVLRISAEGELLGTSGLYSNVFFSDVAVSMVGATPVLGWSEQVTPEGQYATYIAQFMDGAIRNQHQISASSEIALSSAGNSGIALWSDGPGLQHAVLDGQGVTQRPVLTASSATEQRMLSAARATSGTAAVWQERRGDTIFTAFALRKNDGTLVSRAPLFPSEEPQYSPVIATDGDGFAVAWYQRTPVAIELHAARLSADGSPVGDPITVSSKTAPTSIVSWPTFAPPAIAWNGSKWLLAWTRNSTMTLAVARLTRDGVLLDPEGVELYTSPRHARVVWPNILTVNGATFVFFQDGDESYQCTLSSCPIIPPGQVLEMRLDADAHPLDPLPIAISPGKTYETRPSVAWNGEEFLVIYRSGGDLVAQRVDAKGVVIGEPFLLFGLDGTIAADRFSVGAMGRRFLVAVATDRWYSDVSLVTVDGATVSEPVAITTGMERETWPRVLATSPVAASVFFEGTGASGTSTASIARLYFRNVYTQSIRRRAVR